MGEKCLNRLLRGTMGKKRLRYSSRIMNWAFVALFAGV